MLLPEVLSKGTLGGKMIDSIMLILVGLAGILTPFIILSFGLCLLLGLCSVLKAAYENWISARHRRAYRLAQEEAKAYKALPQCPEGEASHGPMPDCKIAA